MPHSNVIVSGILEEYTKKQRVFYSKDGEITFLQNVGNLSHIICIVAFRLH
jgi:hypothetical protein